MIGIVFLMGLVTKNAILLVDFSNQGQRNGMSRNEALLAAGQIRLRPIRGSRSAQDSDLMSILQTCVAPHKSRCALVRTGCG